MKEVGIGSTFQLRYSISGQRMLKETSSGTGRTFFLYDGTDPICELDDYGRIKALNSFGATGLFSRTTFSQGITPVEPNEPPGDNNMAANEPCYVPDNVEKPGRRKGQPVQREVVGYPGNPCPSPVPTATATALPDPDPDPTPSPEPTPSYPPPPPLGGVQGEVFYVFDERGNAVLRLNKYGGVLSQHKYQAYGKETTTRTSASGASTDPWGFGAQYGYYTDSETGYVYCTFRYYDPATGRWLSRDPIGLGGGQQNLYAYCGGDPINGIDPVGLKVVQLALSLEGGTYSSAALGGSVSGAAGVSGSTAVFFGGQTTTVSTATFAGAAALRGGVIMAGAVATAELIDYFRTGKPRGPFTTLGTAIGDYFFGADGYLEAKQPTLWEIERFDRDKHYGRTPNTVQKRFAKQSGANMIFDHDPPLVQHYYEGACTEQANGIEIYSLPGFMMEQAQREAYGKSLSAGKADPRSNMSSQGAYTRAYGVQMWKAYAGIK